MKAEVLFLLVIASICGSCSKDEKLLERAELVLPGTWKIKSFQLPKDGLGVTYQGHTFIADTTLFDVGSVMISDFSIDQLGAPNDQTYIVICEVTIGSEIFPYSINEIFISGDDLYSQFSYNGPDGLNPIDTPGEQFIYSSFVFNNNYFIEIEDSKNIKLSKASDQARHIINLTKE